MSAIPVAAESASGPSPVEQQAQALLALIETERVRQCTQIRDDAAARAASVRAQAHAEARARMRHAIEEQRRALEDRGAAAQARLATHRRLHRQRRIAALLQLAWEQLPSELLALWQDPVTRSAWAEQVIAAAQARLPESGWRVLHTPDWPAAEQEQLAERIAAAGGAALGFEAQPAMRAGLKVVANGNLVDGSLEGLLADRADVETRLLRMLEEVP